jgi:hypothetical protein
MYSKVLVTLLAANMLSACGPGDDFSSIDPDRARAIGSGGGSSAELKLIEGIYKTSKSGDLHYLHINSSGRVKSYNYEGDSIDNGLNCFSQVTLASGINGIYNSKVITYNTSNKEYTLPSPALTVSFRYDISQGMNTFKTGNNTFGRINLTSSSPRYNVYLGHEFRDIPVDSPTASDITSMLCD